MIQPKLKKGTKSLQFNEATKEWFKTEVEKHTELSVVIEDGETEVVGPDGFSLFIYDDEWIIAFPTGHFRILGEYTYSEEFDSV